MQFCTNALQACLGRCDGILDMCNSGMRFWEARFWICAILQNAFLGRMHFWDGAMLDILDTCNSTPRRVRVRGHAIVRVHRGRSVSDVERILELCNQ